MKITKPNSLSGKYKFIKNYDFPTYRQDVAFISFKQNDVINVDYINQKQNYSSLVGTYTEPAHLLYKSDLNNLSFKIPLDLVVKVDNNSILSKIKKSNFQQAEDDSMKKFNTNTQKQKLFIEMNQGYIIIAVVLVAGYFAYKKIVK